MKNHRTLFRVIQIVLTLLLLFLMYWFLLPPLNLRSTDFWTFLVAGAAIVYLLNFFVFPNGALRVKDGQVQVGQMEFKPGRLRRVTKCFLYPILGVIAAGIVASLIGSPLFFASSYKNLITKEEGDFAENVAELSMSQIPVVDRDTASRLGLRKLGEMSDLVSQFEIREDYTQINYQGTPYRVTSLAYGDVFKWLGNVNQGLPAYITVNMTNQETALVRLEQGMKYSPSEYLLRNVNRYLRFNYPTKIFETVSFEIDDDGTPYWIAPTVTYRIALWNGKDISGAVLVNAVTGEHYYYDIKDIPAWVDQVYVSSLVIEQLNYNGKYQSGFINSLFGQKGVLQTTSGYNYITVGDDVYLYTGMTSVSGDQSNVGFVLVNLRTKDAKFYAVSGAEEYSAMSSAEGQVQHLSYSATFPLLLNVADRPTYFMSLKDAAGLVKMYAFVDVDRYQVVGTGTSVDEARASYIAKLASEGDVELPDDTVETLNAAGTLSDVRQTVVGGETVFYFRIAGEDAIYAAPLSLDPTLAFVASGDGVTLTYRDENGLRSVTEIHITQVSGD